MTKRRTAGLVLGVSLVVALAALAPAPTRVTAADHLDAPGLTSPAGDPRLDINDLYVFEGADASNTVLAVTVNPAATGDATFAARRDGSYHVRVDLDGDAVEELTFGITFNGDEMQVRRATGRRAESTRARGGVIGEGVTGDVITLKGGGKAWAGLRSDPFFFDLGGFLGTVEGQGSRMFGDGMESDFFDGLNTLAIVIEVPDEALGDQIGVWATTSERDRWRTRQVDRIGRPAINTVVNSSGPIVGAASNAKTLYNEAEPKADGQFTAAVVAALQAYSSLDAEGAYSDEAAAALARVLLPDVITYDTSTAAAGPLNGRALADDVIDVELRIVTGGDPLGLFADRDADGAINGDGVGPHDDYQTVFPYLGEPN